MIGKHLLIITSWIYFTHSSPIKFQQIHFLPATSFIARTDQYSTAGFYDGESRLDHYYGQGFSEPDPFLITDDVQAKQLAAYLYKKGLFFQDIPHTRGLIYNQNERRKNGLKPNRLGSLRPYSPWLRL
ncbi:unnamed protein product [Ceutorhynchus assimilis]|uniref:Uncharacterized protein n=1 Tax=Ceutorhynchus assimilis TaxID=467358 RepID=A0A9N9MGC3_9CUCU|nr:unnamed protein product [Ceutorhynchus assimilis]